MILKNPISDQDIERSLWFIRNKNKIKKIFVVTLLILNVSMYSFFIFKLINILTQKQDLEFASIDFTNYRIQNTPKPLIIEDKNIVNRGDGKYDFIFTISNPNEKIGVVDLKYKILVNDGVLEGDRHSFIMPQETTKIIELGIESKTSIKKIDILLEETKWKRIKQDDLNIFQKDTFQIIDPKIHTSAEDNSTRNWVEFTAKNISAFNFRKNKFYAFIYLGSKIIAVNEIDVDYFKSEEEKKLQSSWYYQIPSYATLTIETKTNLLDQDNYFLE